MSSDTSIVQGKYVQVLELFSQLLQLFLLVVELVDHDHDAREQEDQHL